MRAVLTALLSALLLVRAIPASAQDTGLGGSFINPFPENDTYQVQVVGDWLADGLMGGLGETFATGPGVVVSKKRYDLPALMLNRTDGDLAALEQAFTNDPSHIAIVMLGAQDRYNVGPRLASGQQGNWRNDYAARVDRVMKTLRKGGRAVYWVGLPNMRRWQDNERAQLMNDVFRERAYLNGVRYIDAYASFIDEGGGYSDYGPDITGKVARLRDTDGVHFTDIGYRKLAHFVERELRRDIAQAKDERAVPLAGDASEQARVNPDRARLKADAAPGTPGAPAPGQKAKPKEAAAPPPDEAGKEQKADTGKVDIKVAAPGGTEQIVSVDIVRPAIPASVVALVTRKQSADKPAQMGDILVDQIPGGLTVMSSIVPPRGADGRRRLSPTQTPYFRVFERGDRLPSKPGRADDFTWPRPQATAEVVTPDPPPVAPATTGATQKRR
jgi:hypothetical protein